MNLVFSRVNRPSCSSLPSRHRFSSPLITFVPPLDPLQSVRAAGGEQSTAGRTIVQFQWKHKLTLSECGLGCCWNSSGDVWREQEWKWKRNNKSKNKNNKRKLKWKLSLMILFYREFLAVEHCYSRHQRNRSNYSCNENFAYCANSVLHCSGSIQAQWLVCKSSSVPSFRKGLMTQCVVSSFPWTKQDTLLPD